MWVFDGVKKDIDVDVKRVIWPGASCLIRQVFDDYESYEDNTEYMHEVIEIASLKQRCIAAGEAFLMIFDPVYCVPVRALHEAFVSEFCAHTVSHIMQEIEENNNDLRMDLYPILSKKTRNLLRGPSDNDVENWQHPIGQILVEIVGDGEFEYGAMVHKMDDYGAEFVGRLFAGLNDKPREYFDGYDSEYIEDNINQIVSRCAQIIDFIETYEKNGDFRLHP